MKEGVHGHNGASHARGPVSMGATARGASCHATARADRGFAQKKHGKTKHTIPIQSRLDKRHEEEYLALSSPQSVSHVEFNEEPMFQ